MSIRDGAYLLTVLLLLLFGVPDPAFAEARSIYVGDIITLQITSPNFSEEDLRRKFQDFEIVELKAEAGSYLVSLRTFETGAHKILLGDKDIIIKVQSTLEALPGQGLFEGETWVVEPGFPARRLLVALFCVAAGVFALTGAFVLTRARPKGTVRAEPPYRLFLRRASALEAADDNYFVALTQYFKEYLENLHQIRIIGKTSTEIVAALQGIPDVSPMLPEIRQWLTECDRFKFAGAMVLTEEKQRHYQTLLELAAKMAPPEEDAA